MKNNSQKIAIDKDQFLKILESKVIEETITIDIEDKSVDLLIRGASLDDHIESNSIYNLSRAQTALLLINFKNTADLLDAVNNIKYKHDLNPKTLFEINLFQRCVIKPNFTLSEIVEISKKNPSIVNDVCDKIMSLTN